MTRIAILGGGNMARALIAGALRAGSDPAGICVGEPLEPVRAALARDFGVRVTGDNLDAVAGAGLVLLAVKPQELAGVLAPLRSALQAGHPVLLSIAAGVRVATLQRLAPGLAVIRAMPNRPALAGAGITGLYADSEVSAAARALAAKIMGAAGAVVWVQEESQLDVVTAVSGSGPAYFFWLAEQLAAAGEALGLPAATAQQLAAETLYGAGMLAHGEADLAAQRQAVTSKGGTTAAALAVLTAPEVTAKVHAAVRAAAVRSAELAAESGRRNI